MLEIGAIILMAVTIVPLVLAILAILLLNKKPDPDEEYDPSGRKKFAFMIGLVVLLVGIYFIYQLSGDMENLNLEDNKSLNVLFNAVLFPLVGLGLLVNSRAAPEPLAAEPLEPYLVESEHYLDAHIIETHPTAPAPYAEVEVVEPVPVHAHPIPHHPHPIPHHAQPIQHTPARQMAVVRCPSCGGNFEADVSKGIQCPYCGLSGSS